MSNDHDISVLNSLIQTTLDSAKGFHEAAEDSNAGRHVTLFSEFAQQRQQVARQLQQEVRRLGGEAETETGLLAAAHRAFMNLRETLSGNDEKATVAEVERGEDYIKGKYEKALEDDGLSTGVRSVIQQAFSSVRAGHDRVSALKHSVA